MSRFWSDSIKDLQPYQPGEQPGQAGLIKLNTNENPYPPSPAVAAAIAAANVGSLRLYPDPKAASLRQTVASYHGLQAGQVFVGNGSDEVLAMVFAALLRHQEPVLFPDVSYSFYPVYCRLYAIPWQTVALDDSFRINLDAYRQPCGGIIFPNPNAPTGCLLSLDDIEQLLQWQPDVVVVIDEAYIDFGGKSASCLIDRYPNLLVVQTLSKSRSLAGMRIGLALGQEHLIAGLERVKHSFNSYVLDRLALAAAQASYKDEAYFRKTCQAVIHSRERFMQGLQGMGFEVLPSAANFVFVHHPHYEAPALLQALRERGILVRHFDQPRTRDYLRISIGTETECQCVLAALHELLAIHSVPA